MSNNLFSSFEINSVLNSNLKKKINFNNIAIDSRNVKNNSIFFALKGLKNDGHNYARSVLNKKNSIAVVHQKKFKDNQFIRVKNTQEALQDLGIYARQRTNAKIIGITGSCGKTSLKNLIAHTLKKYGSTYSSQKSFNNHFGVPFSLTNLKQNLNFGIFEIGMSKAGEILSLVSLVRPHIGIITNIGPAHLQNFQNIFGICKAKSEIIEGVVQNGVMILNRDDKYFYFLKKKALINKKKVITFGFSKSDIHLKKINTIKKNIIISVKNKKIRIKCKNFSKSFIYNILATLAVHHALNHKLKKLSNVFFSFSLPEGRGNEIRKKFFGKRIKIINDSYNSNPLSLKEAIVNFSNMKRDNINQKKIILIGDMLELGKRTKYYHQHIATLINKTDIDFVICVGKFSKFTFVSLTKKKRAFYVQNINKIKNKISNYLKNEDVLLIKSSNRIGLFNFLKQI